MNHNHNNQNKNKPNELTKQSHFRVKIASSITKGERRRQERKSKSRQLCKGCHRPPITCVCEALPPKKLFTNTTILVLQHPNEFRKKSLSTVPLLSLVLENIHIKRDYKFTLTDLPLVQEYLKRGQRPLLLFPSDDAISLDDDDDDNEQIEQKSSLKHDIIESVNNHLLIVLDGTWAEAKRMALASTDVVKVCQPVQFTAPATTCIYDEIRKEPSETCLSTLEACAESLILLEGAFHVAEQLKKVLSRMVDIQVTMEQQRHNEPRQKGKQLFVRNRRRRLVEKTMFHKPKPRILEDGAILRPLVLEDAQEIHQNWYHKSKASLHAIEQNCQNGFACFGIEQPHSSSRLCAYILYSKDGSLRMLHVQQPYRRKGYGRALVQEAINVLQKLDKPCVCFIQQDNHAAKGLFSSLGWNVDSNINSDNSIESIHRNKQEKWIWRSEQ